MKVGQFMSYSKRNNFTKKFYKNCTLKPSLRPFGVCKELRQPLLENEIFEAIYLYMTCNGKAIEISSNQHAGLVRFLLTEDSLKFKKGLDLFSTLHFLYIFLIKKFIFCNVT